MDMQDDIAMWLMGMMSCDSVLIRQMIRDVEAPGDDNYAEMFGVDISFDCCPVGVVSR